MRARAIREGSVGLLILFGIGLFGGLVLWLRGLNPGSRTYQLLIQFENTSGMQVGTAVRYRGVAVGRVLQIRPRSNQIEVRVEITQADLRIPSDILIEANQSGLIGETTIDITPRRSLTEAEQALDPSQGDCDSTAILCNGDTLVGEIGVSYESLLRSTEDLAEIFADPELINSLKTTLKNTAVVTDNAIQLTAELTELTLIAKEELSPLAASARQATDNAGAAAKTIDLTVGDVRTLVAANRFNLVNTLDNISQSSDRLASLMTTLSTRVENGDLLNNLEILSANAAAASADLRNASADVSTITASLNTTENLLLIQQTLESARDTFQSAQKILSDVDELTGDPQIRNNIRNLINGLSNLLSSTQLLEQQAQLAVALDPLSRAAQPVTVPVPALPSVSPTALSYQRLQAQIEAIASASARENTPTPDR